MEVASAGSNTITRFIHQQSTHHHEHQTPFSNSRVVGGLDLAGLGVGVDAVEDTVAALDGWEVGQVGQEEQLALQLGRHLVGVLGVQAVDGAAGLGVLLEGRQLGGQQLVDGADGGRAAQGVGVVLALGARGGDPLANLSADRRVRGGQGGDLNKTQDVWRWVWGEERGGLVYRGLWGGRVGWCVDSGRGASDTGGGIRGGG